MIKKYWNKFNIITKDHFYHNGGNIENRRKVVEALVCNFDTNSFAKHNHGIKEKVKINQLELELNFGF
jgi:DNA adenine methylase